MARHAVVRLYAKNNGPHTASFSVSLIFHLEHLVLLGKLIGGFCALSGVFILTLPIPIVVNSFAQFYKNRLWRNEVTDTFLIICIVVSSIILVIIVITTTTGGAQEERADQADSSRPQNCTEVFPHTGRLVMTTEMMVMLAIRIRLIWYILC